ncbi:MAG TPA: hypothetical protein VLH87_06090, partial [Pyrinomonadaceae bacterium]|nr:hypothetical protein [Pyrinomonadaceae bacterium]
MKIPAGSVHHHCSQFNEIYALMQVISAEEFYKAYQSNEAEADKLYQGKIVIVTGTVGTTSTLGEGMGRPAVILVDAHQKPIVNCFGFANE